MEGKQNKMKSAKKTKTKKTKNKKIGEKELERGMNEFTTKQKKH